MDEGKWLKEIETAIETGNDDPTLISKNPTGSWKTLYSALGTKAGKSPTPNLKKAIVDEIQSQWVKTDANLVIKSIEYYFKHGTFFLSRSPELLQLALNKGLNPNLKDKEGVPLFFCVFARAPQDEKVTVIKQLIDRGANVEQALKAFVQYEKDLVQSEKSTDTDKQQALKFAKEWQEYVKTSPKYQEQLCNDYDSALTRESKGFDAFIKELELKVNPPQQKTETYLNPVRQFVINHTKKICIGGAILTVADAAY